MVAPDSPLAEPSGDAADSYHRYREDISLLAASGLDTYRFSLEWSRIEPAEGMVSHAALDHYRRVIDCCLELGVSPGAAGTCVVSLAQSRLRLPERVEPARVNDRHVVGRPDRRARQIRPRAPAEIRYSALCFFTNLLEKTARSTFPEKLERVAAANEDQLGRCQILRTLNDL